MSKTIDTSSFSLSYPVANRDLFNVVEWYLPRREDFLALGLTFLAYFLSAKLATYFIEVVSASPALLWPPAGIALAAVLLKGYRVWPAIFVAAFLASYSNGMPWPTIVGSAFGNTLQPLLGAYFLWLLGFNATFWRTKDALLLFVASLVVSGIVPTVVFAVQGMFGVLDVNGLATRWVRIWSGEILSLLIVTPFITTWISRPPFRLTRIQIFETVVAFLSLLAVTILLFWTPYTQVGRISLAYLVFVPFFWIGLRLRSRFMPMALFIFSVVGLMGIAFAGVNPTGTPVGERLFLVQIFLEFFAVIFLILSSIVDERREASRKLEEHVDKLEVALEQIKVENEAKGDFLAILAHELRNPLAPILSSIEFLKLRRASDSEDTKMLDIAEERVHSMRHLLNDLLDISRISHKKFTLRKEIVRLDEIIQHCVESTRGLLEKKNHTLSVSLPRGEYWVSIDPLRMEQVVVNMLNNAARYTEAGGRISLSCIIDKDYVTLTIRDTGMGIEKAMLRRIFDPFLQVPQRKALGGLGIGLALCKTFVEMHGGDIRAASEGAGKGTTFTIRLPISIIVKSPQKTEEVITDPDTSRSRFKMLVVDDNVDAAQSLGRLLELRGHDVLLAYGGEGALEVATESVPDVIILDIGLPDVDGYEVARRLRKNKTSSILIAITGYGQQDDKEKARNAGFHFHLTKPVGLSEIEGVLSEIGMDR